jgi:autotransporter-associated beta strand protein
VTSSPQLTFSGQTLTIDPTADLTPGVGYYILIASTAVVDTSTNAFAGISDPTAWNFNAAIFDDFNDGNDDGWTRQSPLTILARPPSSASPAATATRSLTSLPKPRLTRPRTRRQPSLGRELRRLLPAERRYRGLGQLPIQHHHRHARPCLRARPRHHRRLLLHGHPQRHARNLPHHQRGTRSPPVATASIGALNHRQRLPPRLHRRRLPAHRPDLQPREPCHPIATISGIDATYASGNSGLIVTSSSDTQTATATFDNYASATFGTPIVKANNIDNLALGSSWVGGVAPTSTDRAKWDSTVTGANTTSLGADLTFGGIVIANPTGPVTINPGNTLSLGAGLVDIDLSAATQDLTLNCALSMGAPNVWDVTSGRTLALGGVVSGSAGVTKQGVGTAILSSANTYTGGTAITAGTLKLSGTGTPGAAGSSVAVSSGALLDLNGTNQSIAFTAGTGVGTVANNSGSGTSRSDFVSQPRIACHLIADNTNSSSWKGRGRGYSNTQNLSTSNSYSGGTTVNAGAFLYNNPNAAGTGTITLTALGRMALQAADWW